MTRLPALPPGASRDFTDPFAERSRPWGFYLVLLVLIALGGLWYFGKLDRYLPEQVQSVEVLGDAAPAKEQPAPSEPAPSAP
jgi:hypothetical protein